jgi:hypothetical protein
MTTVTNRTTAYLTLVTILLTLSMCDSRDKFGTYKLNTKGQQSIISLYKDSTFNETIGKEKCKGRWLTINQSDSIIETTTLSCGTQIFTLTPKRTLKIAEDELIEVKE